MTSTGRDKVPKNSRDIFVNSTTDGCSNHYANASIVSPQSGIVTQFSPDNNSNYSLDAKHSLLNHNHYNDQDNRHIQNRESGSNQSGSDSGLGFTNSISSENSLIVSAGTRIDQISNINTIDCNIYNDGRQSKNPHHHAHNNRKSIDTTAVIDNTGDNKTANKVVSDDVNSHVSKNYVDHNNNNEISGKDANKNLDTLSAITSSKNSIGEKNQRHPNNASPSSLPLSCTKVSSDVKVLADVCETKASVTIGKPRNVVPTKPKHSDGTTHSAANSSAPSNQTTSHDAELDRINRKYHVGYDSHTDASNHSDTDALAVSSQTTSTNNNVPMLKSALKKAFTNTVDAPIKTKRSCRNVSFNQTVIVFCEEIEASSPNEQFDPPIDYQDLPNYGNDPYEISENYDEDDYVKGDQDRQSGAIVREDLDILSKIVGEDASKLSDDQIFGLLENGSLFNNIDLNSGHLSDDDEFTKTRLNSNQSYLCHDAISDTESESSLVIEDCKRESDAILKSNQRVVSSSQVIKEKNHRNTDEDKVVQSNSIDCKLSSCDQNDLSVNLQVSQKNDRTSASQCKVSASLHTRSMPARMKVSPVDNQARRQQHQNVQSNHKNTNQDSDEHKTETNPIYSTSDNINQPKVLHYPSKTENIIKSNPIKVKQSNIEPVILSRPILRGNVFDSIPQKKQLVQDQDFRPIIDSTLIPNSSAIARTNIQTVVSSCIDVQQRPKEINAPSYRLQQPNIVVKNNIQTMQGNPACHICRAIESDLNPVNTSMALGQFNHSIQNDVLLGTAAAELIQQNNMQRSLQQINQSHETGATNLEELKKQPHPLPSNQSCVSCRELSLRKQQQQQQQQPQQQQNYPPQNYFGQASANFGQQPRQIACQLVYVIDQNGNRVKALQVVNPTQHIALNTITGQPARKIFIAPDVNRLPNPSSVSRQHFAHPPDVKNENSNSYAAQNIPAKNAQNFMTGNAQINQQNSLVNRVVAINNQTSFNNQRMQIMNHTASRNHTIYYVRQPLGAQNIRHSLELSPSSTPKSFPDVHEIRRLDGIRAPTASTNFAHRQQVGHASAVQQPQPPQHAGTSMQYQSNSNERISAPKADDADDPSFGFSRRPAVKVVATVANQNVKPSESIPKSIQTGSSNYSLNCVLTNGIVYKKGENDQPQCLVAGSQTLDRKSMNRSQQSHKAAKENIPNTSSMSNINRTISAFPSTVGVTGPRPSYKSKEGDERLIAARQSMEHLTGRSNSQLQDKKDQVRPEAAYVINT